MAEARNNPQQQQPSAAKQPTRETPGTGEGARSMEPYRRGGELARPGSGGSPFSLMQRLMSDMDRLFDNFGLGGSMLGQAAPHFGEALPRGAWAPQVDVFERGNQLVVHADLPGLKQEDVNVSVEPGLLTISGERSHEHEHEKGGVYQCERSFGAFQRGIALPEGVSPESVQASFENGVLEVTMPIPKEQTPRGRNIPISAKAERTGTKH